MNTHYSIEAWTDFARGLDPSGQRSAMQAHLDQGCAECRRRLDLLAETWAMTRQDEANEPPAPVLARAIAIFPSPAVTPTSDWVGALAELLFDSWASPALAGMRSVRGSSRELRYRVGDLEVELQLLPGADLRTMQVLGQLQATPRAASAPSLQQASVQLSLGKSRFSAECNEFGEFQLECPAGPGAVLHIAVPGRTAPVDLKLPD